MNSKHLSFFFCAWAFFFTFQTNAQRTLSGTVKDAETGVPLDAANIVVLRGARAAGFTITDEKGEFSIPLTLSPDTLTLAVSMLGYAPFTDKIGSRSVFHVALKTSAIKLKEVTIRPGRVWGRSDTVRYDASKFLRENDKTVEDLMKRLPGINVDDNGNIRYRGKDIGTMYVEGLDLMGSRYKSVSKNLSAQSVKEVEVLDNHQRIKSLARKVPSDITDINIKLKEDFKDKWNFNPKLSMGFSSDKLLYEAETSAMQIARKSQSLYVLKFSNTGNGITKEADEATGDMLSLPDYRLLPANSASAPLKERRWMFNAAAVATANRLYKLSEDSRLRINIFYTHDNVTQQTHAVTSYFNPSDTLTVEEQKNSRFKTDKFAFSADYENNATTHFLRNKLSVDFSDNAVFTDISGTYNVLQQQNGKSFSVKDNFSFTRTLSNKNVLHSKSVIGYWQRKEQLRFADYYQLFSLKGFYVNAEAGLIIGKTKIAQRYNAGFSADFNTLKTHYRVWAAPSYEYVLRSLKMNVSFPLQAVYFPNTDASLFLPAAAFRADYKINYAWNARLSARYGKESDDIAAFYTQPYFLDYRTRSENKSGTPFARKQLYSLRVEYKNTLQEFFMTGDVFASHNHVNHTFEQHFSDNLFYWTRRYLPHNESAFGVNAVISKEFFNFNAKTSLEMSFWHNQSVQLQNGKLQPFTFQTLSIKPNFSVSPTSNTEISYNGELRRQSSSFGNGAPFNALWNMSHKTSFYYTRRRFDVSVSGEYFRNEIARNNAVNLFFLDASATYKLKNV